MPKDNQGSIEDSILSQSQVGDDERVGVGEGEVDDGAGDTGEGQEAEVSKGGKESSTDGEQKGGAEDIVDSVLKQSSPGGEQDTVKRGQPNPDPAKRGKPEPVVGKDGKVIAQPGPERRLFEKYRNSHTVEVPALRREIEALKSAASFSQFGLSAEEATTGYRLIQSWKSDPKGTLTKLLTQAKAAGIVIDGASGGSLDTNAIKQMIATELQPLRDVRERGEAQRQAQEKAREEYEIFIADFPDAATHTDTIARLLQSKPEMSLREAYYALQSFYHKNGYDWSVPLQQMSASTGKRPVPRQGTTTLPRGRGVQAQAVETSGNPDATPMPAASSWDSIIESAFKEAGY